MGVKNERLQLIATKSVNKSSVEGLGIYANKECFYIFLSLPRSLLLASD